MTCNFKCLSSDSKSLKADAHFCPLCSPPHTCAHSVMELGGNCSSAAVTLQGFGYKGHICVNMLMYIGC